MSDTKSTTPTIPGPGSGNQQQAAPAASCTSPGPKLKMGIPCRTPQIRAPYRRQEARQPGFQTRCLHKYHNQEAGKQAGEQAAGSRFLYFLHNHP